MNNRNAYFQAKFKPPNMQSDEVTVYHGIIFAFFTQISVHHVHNVIFSNAMAILQMERPGAASSCRWQHQQVKGHYCTASACNIRPL